MNNLPPIEDNELPLPSHKSLDIRSKNGPECFRYLTSSHIFFFKPTYNYVQFTVERFYVKNIVIVLLKIWKMDITQDC